MGQLARRRFMRTMRTAPNDGGPPAGGGGGGNSGGQQNQGGGQQGAGGGGPPNQGGNQNQNQGGQNQGGQGGQQQNQGGSVLDAARQGAGGFDGNQGQQQGGQQNQQQGGQQGAVDPGVLAAIGQAVESAVDRRVNALNNPGGGRRNQQQGNGNQNQQGGQGNDGGQQQVHSVDQGARREARLAFREYVGDQVRFLSDVERGVAVRMGTAAIATWDGDGDADAFGRQVAGEVATAIQELGRMYERITTEALRKAGRLKDDGQQGPGAGSGPAGFALTASNGFQLPTGQHGLVNQKNPQQAVNNAAALAAQYNQASGHQPAQQATT